MKEGGGTNKQRTFPSPSMPTGPAVSQGNLAYNVPREEARCAKRRITAPQKGSLVCYVSTRRQPDLGGALSDCHLLSCAGFLQRVFSQCLIRDGTLQHVSSET